MAEEKTGPDGRGCLALVFTLMGMALIAFNVFNQFQNSSGGRFNFQFTGAFVPGLVLIAMGRALGRRSRASSRSGSDQIPAKPPAVKKPAPPPPAPKQAPPPIVVIPELPDVEEVHQQGALPAVEDLELSDFKPDRPLSSEERIRLAKEQYKKP